jgi:hypothetical protein
MRMGRYSYLEKAFKMVRLFDRKEYVTYKDVQNELGLNHRHGAHDWVNAMSLVYPITEEWNKNRVRFYRVDQ